MDYYELRYTNIPNSCEHIDIGNWRTMPMPNFDLAAPDKLSSVFCSARCLAGYVQAHVAPTLLATRFIAATERWTAARP